MAKYTVTHSCGHTREVNLIGKNSERERKLEWYSRNECPRCWTQKQPVTLEAGLTRFNHPYSVPVVEFVLTGNTWPHKDKIKSLRYFWGESYSGFGDISDLLGAKSRMVWRKTIPIRALGLDEDKIYESIGILIQQEYEAMPDIVKDIKFTSGPLARYSIINDVRDYIDVRTNFKGWFKKLRELRQQSEEGKTPSDFKIQEDKKSGKTNL
jgi:hypothetical protein